MAEQESDTINLKELGIETDTTWWDTALQAGMVITAIFQVICLIFAVFGSSSSSQLEKERQEPTSKGSPRRKGSSSPIDNANSVGVPQARRRIKLDKKKK